jgi:Zn-dependent peptidase ImmA (M78 family)
MAYMARKNISRRKASADLSNVNTPSALLAFARENGITTEPLDVAQLVQVLGIKLRFEPMKDDDSGRLEKDNNGNWCMHVNSLHHPNRQRFTIAHELGHRFLHGDNRSEFADKIFFRSNQLDREESDANAFAAELLMPVDSFRSFVSDTSSKVENIANHFQVSSLAVRYRARALGYSGHNV